MINNNDLKLTGLTIKNASTNIAPAIYLESFYRDYENGMELQNVIKEIADTHIQHEVKTAFDTSIITDLSKCACSIFPRIISRELNADLLANRPFTEIADLAITYHIELGSSADGNMSVPITNRLLECWNISKAELHAIALKNNSEAIKYTLTSINDVMRDIMKSQLVQEVNNEDDLNQMIEAMLPNDVMYVLTNENKINGAAALLDDATMQMITEKFGNHFFILPSSIHETLIVPAAIADSVDSLKAMVKEVNETQVADNEILSNNVYIYTSHGIEIAE